MSRKKELEIVQHTNMKHLEIFLVEMTARGPHGHDDLEIGVIQKGAVTLVLEQKSYTLKQGDIYLINRHQVHSFARTDADNLILAFQIKSEFYKQTDYSLGFLGFENNIIHSGQLHDALLKSLYECIGFYFKDTPYNALKCSSIMLDVLYQLACSPHCRMATEKESASACNNTLRLKHITDYINENYTDHISLQDIAALENITVYHVSHFIKNMLGISFQEYINQLRFTHALTLIRKTDLSILDICMETGFSSSRYLNQMFLKNFQCTAREYMKMKEKPRLISAALPTNNIQKRYTYEQAAAYMRGL